MKPLGTSLVWSVILVLAGGAAVGAMDPSPDTTVLEPETSGPLSAMSPVSFEMTPVDGPSIGWWKQVARVGHVGDVVIGFPGDIAVIGDQLVAVGTVCPPEGRCRDVAWRSSDGVSWNEVTLPGEMARVTAMTARPDGSQAIVLGGVRESHQAHGAAWSTSDGTTWALHTAPRGAEWAAASDEMVVVAAGGRLWASRDLTSWRPVDGPGGLPVAYGPGGFLAWGGGGQDRVQPTELWRSPDGRTWRHVDLPRGLRAGDDAWGEVQVFAVDDRWVLVPDEVKLPRSVYISRDGRTWHPAPRPAGMSVGYTWWVDREGRYAQAFGWLPELRGQPSGMWTWPLGRRSGPADAWPEDHIGRPVEFQGQRLALGETWGETPGLALWRWDLTEDELALVSGARLDLQGTCQPLRDGLLGAAVGGMECLPTSDEVERVRVFAFPSEREMLDAYWAIVSELGLEPASRHPGGCRADGSSEGSYYPTPPEEELTVPYRSACYVDHDGIAHYLATHLSTTASSRHLLLEVVGTGVDVETVNRFAWLGNQDQPGEPTIWALTPQSAET